MSIDILVLDDSSVMRKIVIRTLRQSGTAIGDIKEAGGGEEGLKIINDGFHPELILSDVNMDGMDGITFVQHARKILTPQKTKIVMITTESSHDKVQAAIAAGANAYLTKPFTADQMTQKIGDLF